ncbi:MAG: molybdopterin-guanine dinucleotide biosynthesis protein B [Spirochaetes bacterium]|nr:molybdopterin-guanine dinucleotide biosynthesis protein B [Spirochaetota bacterium]
MKKSAKVPIVSIIGWSGSGKTTLLEKLIPELAGRGCRVATVKHYSHGFDMDREGKDTWRHRKAGAACTVLSSAGQLALVRDMDHDASLDEIRDRFIHDADIILSEGFKRDSAPKIEVFREALGEEPLCRTIDDVMAVMSDVPLGVGCICLGLDEVGKLADLIEENFLKT